MSVPVVIYFDGACEPRNPGGYGLWAWVALARDGSEVAHDYGSLGRGPDMTNNRAEYAALLEALHYLELHDFRNVVVRGDSQLVVRQVNGEWACNSPHLQPLCRLAQISCEAATIARLEWVPREKNVRADGYSRQAYNEARAGVLPASING